MPGLILIASQVEALHLEVRNLYPIQFFNQSGGNLKFRGQKPVPGPILIVGQVETLHLEDKNLPGPILIAG